MAVEQIHFPCAMFAMVALCPAPQPPRPFSFFLVVTLLFPDLKYFLARLFALSANCFLPYLLSVSRLTILDRMKALAVAALTHNARAAVCVFSAGATHQLRDSTRRGLWLYPPRGPKTPPVSYPIYLLAQALLPLLVAICLRSGHRSRCGYSSCVQRESSGWGTCGFAGVQVLTSLFFFC